MAVRGPGLGCAQWPPGRRTKCSSSSSAWQFPFKVGSRSLIDGNFQDHLQQSLDVFHLHSLVGFSFSLSWMRQELCLLPGVKGEEFVPSSS